jgi:hypothetical protein
MSLLTLFGIQDILLAQTKFLTHDIRARLLSDSQTSIDHTTVDFWNDVSANELPTANGYTQGGILLANKSLVVDTTANRAELHFDPVTWDPSTLTARWYVLVRDTGNAATSPIIGFHDFGANKTSLAGPFTLTDQDDPGGFSLTFSGTGLLFFEHTLDAILGGDIDFEDDTLHWGLLTDAASPDVNTHDFWADLNGNEVANGNGYTTNGLALGSKNIEIDTGLNLVKLTSTTPARWSAASITARYAVLFKWTGSAATSPLIGLYDFEENKTSVNSTFDLNQHASGWLRFFNVAA